MPSSFPVLVVPAVGGGLNLALHPAHIRDDMWTGCNGFVPLDGAAEQLPTFTALGSPLAGTGDDPLGIVTDAFNDQEMLVGFEDSGELLLIRVHSTTGTPTTITRSGGTADPVANNADVLTTGFLNGYQVLAAGIPGGAGSTSSLIRYLGGATYDTIDPPAGEKLQAGAIVSFGAHLIAAPAMRFGTSVTAEWRRVAWSAANNESLWLPALSNDADDLQLDDVESPVVGVVRLGADAVGLLTRDTIYGLIPTGRIPSFTRATLIPGVGCTLVRATTGIDARRSGIYGALPFGAVVVASDRIYLLSGGQARPIGQPILDYFFAHGKLNPIALPSLLRPICYHGAWRQLILPRFDEVDGECLLGEIGSDAWGRVVLGDVLGVGARPARQAVIRTSNGLRWIFLDDDRQLWTEDYTTGFPNAFIETKDFSLEGEQAYYDDLLLEWEPLVSPTTTVEISVAARDDLPVGFGTLGRDIAPSFTVLGTLTNGASRLGLTAVPRGRFQRFRFRTTVGRVRIRGFKLARKAAGRRV